MTEDSKLEPVEVLAVCRQRIRDAVLSLLRHGAPQWQVREALRGAEADWDDIAHELETTCARCGQPMVLDEIYQARSRKDFLCDPCYQGDSDG